MVDDYDFVEVILIATFYNLIDTGYTFERNSQAMNSEDFRKNLTAKEISELFYQALNEVTRPANERVLNDSQLCQMLSVSKRTTATWRATGVLAHHKVGGIVFYLHSDVLEMLQKNRIEPLSSKLNIRL
jgi:hypothetical protein